MNIFDTINDLVSQAGTAFRGIVGLVAAIIFVVVAVKTKAVAATVIVGILAAFIIFMVAGGLELFSSQLGNTVQG